MRRIARLVIDVAAINAVGLVVYFAHGLPWALGAMTLTLAYSCWCFADGVITADETPNPRPSR
jgi:hypothetical protein